MFTKTGQALDTSDSNFARSVSKDLSTITAHMDKERWTRHLPLTYLDCYYRYTYSVNKLNAKFWYCRVDDFILKIVFLNVLKKKKL